MGRQRHYWQDPSSSLLILFITTVGRKYLDIIHSGKHSGNNIDNSNKFHSAEPKPNLPVRVSVTNVHQKQSQILMWVYLTLLDMKRFRGSGLEVCRRCFRVDKWLTAPWWHHCTTKTVAGESEGTNQLNHHSVAHGGKATRSSNRSNKVQRSNTWVRLSLQKASSAQLSRQWTVVVLRCSNKMLYT